MKKENISDALNNIDFDMVEDVYDNAKSKKKIQKSIWLKWGTIAACFTLMIVVAVTVLPENAGVLELGNQTDSTDSPSTETMGAKPIGTDPIGTQAGDPSLYAPKEFTSLEEFVAYEKSLGEASSKCYYIPSALGDEYELYTIMRQEKNSTITYEHITVKYKLKGEDIDEENFIDLRTKIISCEYSVREYSDTAFESYTNNGFEAFEYGGRQLYKKDNYSADNTTLLSYRVIFRIDGHLIGMHLPATDSFENMMKYTDVIRVNIE